MWVTVHFGFEYNLDFMVSSQLYCITLVDTLVSFLILSGLLLTPNPIPTFFSLQITYKTNKQMKQHQFISSTCRIKVLCFWVKWFDSEIWDWWRDGQYREIFCSWVLPGVNWSCCKLPMESQVTTITTSSNITMTNTATGVHATVINYLPMCSPNLWRNCT